MSIPTVKINRDGSEVCADTKAGLREYFRRLSDMQIRQDGLCAICDQWLGMDATFEHERSRGGGKRDDRITNPDGSWKNAATHMRCNMLKGSVRYAWVDGKFVPAT